MSKKRRKFVIDTLKISVISQPSILTKTGLKLRRRIAGDQITQKRDSQPAAKRRSKKYKTGIKNKNPINFRACLVKLNSRVSF